MVRSNILFFLAITFQTVLFAQKLIPISIVDLGIDEPSGIAFNKELSGPKGTDLELFLF